MEAPSLTAMVVPALNRRPWDLEEAVEIVADDGKTPLRMILPALGFKPGQKVRIEVIDLESEVEDEEDPFLS